MSTNNYSLYDATYERNWERARVLLRLRNARQLVEYIEADDDERESFRTLLECTRHIRKCLADPQYLQLEQSGRNCLHNLLEYDYPPADVLRDVLAASSKAPLQQEASGNTPLHIAVSKWTNWDALRSSWDMIEEKIDELTDPIMKLIEACPQAAAVKDAFGRTPLHMAVTNCLKSPKVIGRLLSVNPSAVTASDLNGKIPLDSFFDGWDLQLRYVLKLAHDNKRSIHDFFVRNVGDDIETKIDEVYETAILLLQAATCGTMEDSQTNFQTLHAAINTQCCPWSFLELILKIDPKQAHLQDEEGNFALHAVAAKSPSNGEVHECVNCMLKFNENSNSWYQDMSTTYYIYCHECSQDVREDLIFMKSDDIVQSVIKDLIDANPKSASFPNHNNRLPLNIAIKNNKAFEEGGIKAIFQAAPTALSTRDIETFMYPFMLAAVGHNEKKKGRKAGKKSKPSDGYLQKFSCCYALLVENPVLVSSGIFERGNKRKQTGKPKRR